MNFTTNAYAHKINIGMDLFACFNHLAVVGEFGMGKK